MSDATKMRPKVETAEIVELRMLGLSVDETAAVLDVHRTTVMRRTRGHDLTPTLVVPERLTSPRARAVWLAMQRERARRKDGGLAAVERKVARVLKLADEGRP